MNATSISGSLEATTVKDDRLRNKISTIVITNEQILLTIPITFDFVYFFPNEQKNIAHNNIVELLRLAFGSS